jgi:hypothetical protein
MAWRSVFRLRRRDRRRQAVEQALTEEDVQRLQRVQRTAASAVKVLRRDQ